MKEQEKKKKKKNKNALEAYMLSVLEKSMKQTLDKALNDLLRDFK